MNDEANQIAEFETEAAPDFDPAEAAKMLGLSDKQYKFALARLKGANKTQSARAAGYGGSDEDMRSTGSRVAASEKVKAFLKWAETSGAGVPDEPCDSVELKRILSRHARGDDKNTAIRAAEVLHRICNAEAVDEGEGDPADTLAEIAEIVPALAATLAQEHNIKFILTPEQQVRATAFQRQAAFAWIRDNTREAMALAQLQPMETQS